MRWFGLDVGRSAAEVAVVERGRPTRSLGKIGVSAESLRAFAATLGPDDAVCLEATTNTWPIAELLGQHAGRVVVSNPLRTRAIADAKTKTDTIDAATLAELLAADYLPEVWQPDPATQALRRRVAARAALVGLRTRLRNRISAVLARNLVVNPWSDPFGRSGRRWLAAVALPADEREGVETDLRLLDALEAEISVAEQGLARLVADDPRVRRLMTIPGVGAMTAIGLVACIGDVRRFPRPNKLVNYLGLDPRVRQSGGRPAWIGHISQAGQGYVRGLLTEAAHVAVRTPGPLHAFHARVLARRGPGIAAVAVARKLTVLAWHLLHDETDYRWAPTARTTRKLHDLERAAGAPSRRGWPAGSRRIDPEIERRHLYEAEAAYVAFVDARGADAAAANGVRLKGQRPAARRSSTPRSALRFGVDRVQPEDTPASIDGQPSAR
jgi:transposase